MTLLHRIVSRTPHNFLDSNPNPHRRRRTRSMLHSPSSTPPQDTRDPRIHCRNSHNFLGSSSGPRNQTRMPSKSRRMCSEHRCRSTPPDTPAHKRRSFASRCSSRCRTCLRSSRMRLTGRVDRSRWRCIRQSQGQGCRQLASVLRNRSFRAALRSVASCPHLLQRPGSPRRTEWTLGQ